MILICFVEHLTDEHLTTRKQSAKQAAGKPSRDRQPAVRDPRVQGAQPMTRHVPVWHLQALMHVALIVAMCAATNVYKR